MDVYDSLLEAVKTEYVPVRTLRSGPRGSISVIRHLESGQRRVFRRYAPDSPDKRRALELMREGRVGTTLFGAGDRNPRRLVAMGKLWLRYVDDYRRYFGNRELDA